MAHFKLIDWNAVALGAIREWRKPIYTKPLLRKAGKTERTAAGEKNADEGHERRRMLRQLHGELSRYFLLQGKKKSWSTTTLVSKGEREDDHSKS